MSLHAIEMKSEILNRINIALYALIGAGLFLLMYIDFIRNDARIHRALSHLEKVVLKS